MLTFFAIIGIIVFGYHLMALMIKIGFAIMYALAMLSMYFIIIYALISVYGIIILPIIAFVFGMFMLCRICKFVVHQTRQPLFRRL